MTASDPAAWVQASAGVIQAVAAVVLWLITAKYVRLTSAMSSTADKQLQYLLAAQEAARRADLREFAYLTKRLADMVRAFPLSQSIHDYGGLIVRGALWTDEDLHQLAQLAAKTSKDFTEASVQPLIDLTWLRERIQHVKNAWPNTSSQISAIPWQEWYDRHQATLNALDTLHWHAREAAASSTVAAI